METQVNAAIVPPKPQVIAKNPTLRTRDASWEWWVAAVTIIAAEGRISRGMKHKDLRDAVVEKLEAWGIPDKEVPTVTPAISRILERFLTHPPVRQIGI